MFKFSNNWFFVIIVLLLKITINISFENYFRKDTFSKIKLLHFKKIVNRNSLKIEINFQKLQIFELAITCHTAK